MPTTRLPPDCWSAPQRDADGRLQPHPERYPDGIKALGDYAHLRGLKLGIYGDAGHMVSAGSRAAQRGSRVLSTAVLTHEQPGTRTPPPLRACPIVTQTCDGLPGSLGHEREDAALFASWGVGECWGP